MKHPNLSAGPIESRPFDRQRPDRPTGAEASGRSPNRMRACFARRRAKPSCPLSSVRSHRAGFLSNNRRGGGARCIRPVRCAVDLWRDTLAGKASDRVAMSRTIGVRKEKERRWR